ncbi:MAG: Lrp/AsnC ligand binding domain-containing protein, partial [Pseudomonadota bacterium]
CAPGQTYAVADALAHKEVHSEMYSTSGTYDLLLKIYVPDGEDTGRFINRMIVDVAGIERSLTTMTFQAF